MNVCGAEKHRELEILDVSDCSELEALHTNVSDLL